MDNNKIIIVLLLVIIVLLVVFALVFINPTNAKTGTAITITSNSTLHDGDDFSTVLTDINGTPLANQTVNITIIDANGAKNQQQVTTDGMGNGILQLNGLAVGNYTVNVTYGGNDDYLDTFSSKEFSINKVAKESNSQSTSTGNAYVDRILNDPTCHVVKDPFSICPKHGVPYYQDNRCDWFVQPL